MSTAHSIALGILIAIGLLSVIGFIQLLMLPLDIASRVLIGFADAKLRAHEEEQAYRKQIEAEVAREQAKTRCREEVPDGRG
ncbi:hypothetical protein ACS0OT_07115 [Stenotrophomonas maltophilia group sp. RY12688]|uniref:hypothetical protein n=1 Tax=Stenotrophomonas maltophilia group sp. RY12688 TaxID=3454438 RepID=UPI003F963D97